MKKFIRYFSAPLIISALAAIIFYAPSFAETVTATSVEQQVGRLATALEGLLVQAKQPAMSQTMSANLGITNPTCLDNYDTWKKSSAYTNNSKWNVDFIPFTGSITSGASHPGNDNFLDLNGDGLSDYIYNERAESSISSVRRGGSCIYMNNGSGFDLVYKCYAIADNNGSDFYGDCAG